MYGLISQIVTSDYLTSYQWTANPRYLHHWAISPASLSEPMVEG